MGSVFDSVFHCSFCDSENYLFVFSLGLKVGRFLFKFDLQANLKYN
jgi:hypothetical protein